jgi:hypothetical protein
MKRAHHPAPSDAEFETVLEKTGLRSTPQRHHVYSVLLGKKDHPRRRRCFIRAKRGMPDISMATVYNCLDALVSCGVGRQGEPEPLGHALPARTCSRTTIFIVTDAAEPMTSTVRWTTPSPPLRFPAGSGRPAMKHHSRRCAPNAPARPANDGTDPLPAVTALTTNSESTATETIEGFVKQDYRYGFVTRRRDGLGPAGVERRHHPPDLPQEERAGVAAGMEAEGYGIGRR